MHKDHADFMYALDPYLFWQMHVSSSEKILTGISYENISWGDLVGVHVEVGHNLKFFASMVRNSHPWKSVAVLGWLDKQCCVLKFGLSGRERYLGESTLEDARCEMYRECSTKPSLPEVCEG